MPHIPYFPPPPKQVKLDGNLPQVPEVLPRPEPKKMPTMQIVMIVVMVLFVGGMIFMVVRQGAENLTSNPMMMMMPMMMIMMMASMIMGSQAQDDSQRGVIHWLLQATETRKGFHIQAKAMFEGQRSLFPQPEVVYRLIGSDHLHRDGDETVGPMWTIGYEREAGLSTSSDPGAGEGITYNPYLAARVGTGVVKLEPGPEIEPLQVAENLEPTTMVLYSDFMRNQRFVPGMPVAYDLRRAPYYVVEGERHLTVSLARAMLVSLMYNHPPSELAIIVVSQSPDRSPWASLKWAPHTQDPNVRADGNTNLLMFSSMEQMWEHTEDLRAGRGTFGSTTSGAPLTPRLLILVDPGNDEWSLPKGLDSRGLYGATILSIGHGPQGVTVSDSSTLFVRQAAPAQRGNPAVVLLSTGQDRDIVRADQLDAHIFELTNRTMSRYRPYDWDQSGQLVAAIPSGESNRTPTYLSAIGIEVPLEEYDVRQSWRRTELDPHMVVPVGHKLDDDGNMLPELLTLDLSMVSKGGSGPSGMVQGMTGSGKSFFLRSFVLTMCALFSPDRINFILQDFKAGASFIGMEGLPHVQAVLTNLEEDAEQMSRSRDVIEGEIARREELIVKIAKVEDIDAYRIKRDRHPELGLEALPDLIIIADEFRDYIMNNREDMKMWDSSAQKGRALGLHLMLVSQFIDAGVIGDVLQNLTYGISLKASSASYSQTVIGSPAAASLPLGAGDAYLRQDGGTGSLDRFRGFNHAAPYAPVIEGEDDQPVSRAVLSNMQAAISTADGRSVKPFLIHSHRLTIDGEVVDEPIEITTGEVAAVTDDRLSEGQALLDYLVALGVTAPHRMWLPPLRKPLPVRQCNVPEKVDSARLEFRIGLLDEPRKHRRVGWGIRPEDQSAHIRVAGARGSGVSTTIEAIIASAGLSYGPDRCQFYIIDAGSKLREVSSWPNVGTYTRASSNPDDIERCDRLLGEFLRIARNRGDQISERGLTNFEDYWRSKQADPVPSDPYGHMFLVIDHIHEFLAEDDPDGSRVNRLITIANEGGSRGIHLIVGGGAQTMKYTLDPVFGQIIHHYVSDLTNSSMTYAIEQKPHIKQIPVGEPGRVFSMEANLHGRIMMPHEGDPVEAAESESNRIVWDYRVDWTEQLAQFGDRLRRLWDGASAPEIATVPKKLGVTAVENLNKMNIAAGASRFQIPLGVSAEDLSLVALPDPKVSAEMSPHLVIAGDQQTGRTTVLRWLLRWILGNYQSGEALVYIIDGSYSLINERSYIEQAGLLGGYAADRKSHEKILTPVVDVLKARQPGESVTARQMRDRAWWSGPEIFVIADPVNALATGSGFSYGTGSGVIDQFAELLVERNDVGVRAWMTTSAHDFQTTMTTMPILRHVVPAGASTLLLSSTTPGTLFGSMMSAEGAVRFARRRPGMGQLYNPKWQHHPILQVPMDLEWPEIE